MKIIVILILSALTLSPLTAQNLINDGSVKNRIYTKVSVEPTTMFALGYQRNFRIGNLKNQLTTYLELNNAFHKFLAQNNELNIGGIIPLFESGSFKVVNDLYLSAGRTSNVNFKSHKFTVGDEISVGWYKEKWYVAALAEYEKIYLNEFTFTENYRDRFFEDAEDGWYKGGGGRIQFGLEAGLTFKEKFDLYVAVKSPFTEQLNRYIGSPLHLNLGFGYRI
jgi:hypothetical protein